MRYLLAFALLSFALARCAVFGGAKERALQHNPSFRGGYEDGCAAATDQGSDLRGRFVGDSQLYQGDDVYRAGWKSGFQTCRRSDIEAGAGAGDNPVAPPEPGGH
ncbi:MAG TPA: hypothetical protein VIY09_08385 [Rhizomicrobium sp.]